MAACSFSSSKKEKNSVSSSKQPSYLYSSHRYDHFHQVILSDGDTDLFEFEFELEESDVFWGPDDDGPGNVPSSKSIPRSATSMIPPAVTINASGRKKRLVSAASLPVNVPDWSRVRQLWESDDDAGEEWGGGGGDGTIMAEKVPPHEYLARRRGESSSVREGMGRTLKGMELCRFRNEILKKLVGFED